MKRILALTALLLPALFGPAAKAQTVIKTATYNLRYNNPKDGANAWDNRKQMVQGLILYHDFDIFGTQEGLIDQLLYLDSIPGYARFGVGRNDGGRQGEHSAVFYKTGRFELLECGDFWLSPTPEVPSQGWERSTKRITSWGKLRDKSTGAEFYFFNTHMDHISTLSRQLGAQLILDRIRSLSGGLPVILTGDLNATPGSDPVALLKAVLHDAHDHTISPAYGPEGTFNWFDISRPTADRIDYIWVTPSIQVHSYAVLTDSKDQRFSSDHFPVTATVQLPEYTVKGLP